MGRVVASAHFDRSDFHAVSARGPWQIALGCLDRYAPETRHRGVRVEAELGDVRMAASCVAHCTELDAPRRMPVTDRHRRRVLYAEGPPGLGLETARSVVGAGLGPNLRIAGSDTKAIYAREQMMFVRANAARATPTLCRGGSRGRAKRMIAEVVALDIELDAHLLLGASAVGLPITTWTEIGAAPVLDDLAPAALTRVAAAGER